MAKRKKEKRTYKYECNLTGESFILTEKAKNADDLMSIKGYYEMNPEEDDRPDHVKKMLGVSSESEE